jgi:hypothetical protein
MIVKRWSVKLSLLFIVFLLLIGCSSAHSTTTIPTMVSTLTAAAPTTVPLQVTNDTGALKVTLISSKTNQPLVDALIRCATMLKMQGAMVGVYVPSLDMSNSPWGNTDTTGTTNISNIKPDKYALAYIFPIGAPELVKLEGSDNDFTFDIEAGKVLDLGTLKVDIDPNQIH